MSSVPSKLKLFTVSGRSQLVDMEWETAPVCPLSVKVEPEDDPLAGAVPPTQEDVTVPEEEVTASLQNTGTGRIKVVDLKNLLQKPSGLKETIDPVQGIASESRNCPDISEEASSQPALIPLPQTVPAEPVQGIASEIRIHPDISEEASSQPALIHLSQTVPAEPVTVITVDDTDDEEQGGNKSKALTVEDELSDFLLIKPSSSSGTGANNSVLCSDQQQPVQPAVTIPPSQTTLVSTPASALQEDDAIIVRTANGLYLARPLMTPMRPLLPKPGGKCPNPMKKRRSQTVSVANNQKISNLASSKQATTQKPQMTNRKNALNQKDTVPGPPEASSAKPVWPPPWWTKKKMKPKSLPLSGSWTNPKPPSLPPVAPQDRDPLDGPELPIVPYNGSAPSSIQRHRSIGPCNDIATNRIPSSKTQCCTTPAPHREALSFEAQEPPDLKRPWLNDIISRGVGISVQSKLILYNVYKYFDRRKNRYNLSYVPAEVTESATGVKAITLRKILREAKKSCNIYDQSSVPRFKAPSRAKYEAKTIHASMHMDSAVRRCMHEHFLTKEEAPTLKKLGSRCGIRSHRCVELIARKIGLETVRTARRPITVEGTAIRAWRYNYLKQIGLSFEANKNVVFTFVVELRQLDVSKGFLIVEPGDKLKGQYRILTVFCAADENAIIKSSFKVIDAVVDPARPPKELQHVVWLERQVLQNIPKGSVVVLASDKYHNKEDGELRPNAGSSKKEVVDWLRSRLAWEADESLPKCVLLEEASRVPVKVKYSIDSLVETYGHTAVHLPTSQRDLNPLEYIWEKVRDKMSHMNKLKTDVESLAKEFVSHEHLLPSYWQLAKTIADGYRQSDPLLESATEAFIRKLGGVRISSTNGPSGETGGDQDVDLDGSESGSDSASSSKPCSGSDSDSDSSDDDVEASSSTSSGSEDSDDDVPHPEHARGNKRRKIE